jgi:hypothetical protein
MSRAIVDTRVFTDPSWWHWAVTIPLLVAHVSGLPSAIEAALGLCAAMTLSYLACFRRLLPFPVQVRLTYLAWLLVGLLPAMRWMHYVALAGTTAMVLVGYCLLARMLNLAWFSRTGPLTLSLFQSVCLSPPDGGLFHWRPNLETAPLRSCSLRRGGAGAQGRG